MEQLADLIAQHFPKWAAIITESIFVLFLVLQISDDFDKVKAFIKRLFDFRRYVDKIIYAKRREQYNKVLSSREYLDWQNKILKTIYGDLIEKKNRQFKEKYPDQKNLQISITELELDNHKYQYESVTLKLNPVSYPFSGVCPKSKLNTYSDISKAGDLDIIQNFNAEVKRYYRLIKSTIRYPKRLGYMLGEITIGKTGWEVTAYTGNYENNLKTSHILEYELYLLYRKNKKNHGNIETKSKDEILEKLPIRNKIHKSFIEDKKNHDESDILISGKYRVSLLGVQMFVLVKNNSGSYDALRIRRSTDVAAKPGFLQFIPSGGFEAMNDCIDFDAQWDNYSISKAVFRELLEECFGQDEDDKLTSGNNISPERIYHNTCIKQLLQMLNENNPPARMSLLGTTMSLVSLRHELSFILCVDNPDFAAKLIGNYESKTAIHLVDIHNLERFNYWHRSEKAGKKCEGQKNTNLDDLQNLNCTSAGLFELAKESDIYKECENKCL
jgi:hypothetical protein